MKKKYVEYLTKKVKDTDLKKKFESALLTSKANTKGFQLGHFEIVLSDSQTSYLLDELTDMSVAEGMKDEENVNPEGDFIEEIIDVVVSH